MMGLVNAIIVKQPTKANVYIKELQNVQHMPMIKINLNALIVIVKQFGLIVCA